MRINIEGLAKAGVVVHIDKAQGIIEITPEFYTSLETKALQTQLEEHGLDHGLIDGILGNLHSVVHHQILLKTIMATAD
jgi:hypothetical protein